MKPARLVIVAMSLLISGNAVAADAGAGREKSASCAACHGEWGVSASDQFPSLAGQYADYIVLALKAYRSGERNDAIMAGLVTGLSDKDIEDLAVFYAAQKGLKTMP